jgi:hypothetical protein
MTAQTMFTIGGLTWNLPRTQGLVVTPGEGATAVTPPPLPAAPAPLAEDRTRPVGWSRRRRGRPAAGARRPVTGGPRPRGDTPSRRRPGPLRSCSASCGDAPSRTWTARKTPPPTTQTWRRNVFWGSLTSSCRRLLWTGPGARSPRPWTTSRSSLTPSGGSSSWASPGATGPWRGQ